MKRTYCPEEWLLKTDAGGWQQIIKLDTITKIGDQCHINDCDLSTIVEMHNKDVRVLTYGFDCALKT